MKYSHTLNIIREINHILYDEGLDHVSEIMEI